MVVYNLHKIKFIHFVDSMVTFDKYIYPCNYYYNLYIEYFHHPQVPIPSQCSPSSLSIGKHCSAFLHYQISVSFSSLKFHIEHIILYVLFSVWLLLLIMEFQRLICIIVSMLYLLLLLLSSSILQVYTKICSSRFLLVNIWIIFCF